MKITVKDLQGKDQGQIEISTQLERFEELANRRIGTQAAHEVITAIRAARRSGTACTKTMGDVAGSGKKPWRQKGTGRARQGSIRNIHWKGGAVAFAMKPRSYSYTIPKKLKRVALKSALSSKVLENNIIVLDDLALTGIKTKEFVKVLNNLRVDSSVLVVMPAVDEKVVKSARNVPEVKTALVNTINTYDILKYKKFIITKAAVAKVEEVYA